VVRDSAGNLFYKWESKTMTFTQGETFEVHSVIPGMPLPPPGVYTVRALVRGNGWLGGQGDYLRGAGSAVDRPSAKKKDGLPAERRQPISHRLEPSAGLQHPLLSTPHRTGASVRSSTLGASSSPREGGQITYLKEWTDDVLPHIQKERA
jgi:hypothetical protein